MRTEYQTLRKKIENKIATKERKIEKIKVQLIEARAQIFAMKEVIGLYENESDLHRR